MDDAAPGGGIALANLPPIVTMKVSTPVSADRKWESYPPEAHPLMAEKPPQSPPPQQLNLKDPVLAGFLAWLLPGRAISIKAVTPRAVLYLVCILGTFIYGLYLSSSAATGPARAVYFSFRCGRLAVGLSLPGGPGCRPCRRWSRPSACPTARSRCGTVSWPRRAWKRSTPTSPPIAPWPS